MTQRLVVTKTINPIPEGLTKGLAGCRSLQSQRPWHHSPAPGRIGRCGSSGCACGARTLSSCLAIVILLLGTSRSGARQPTSFPTSRSRLPTVWKIHWPVARGNGDPMILGSERYALTPHTESAHRVAVPRRHFGGQVLLPAQRQRRTVVRADYCRFARTNLRSAPPGTTPPFILAYNASSVPSCSLPVERQSLEAQLFDLANSIIARGLPRCRRRLHALPVRACSARCRSIWIRRAARPRPVRNDVTAAFGAQNSILPRAPRNRRARVLVSVIPTRNVAELNDLPVTTRNGTVIYVRDVAHVRDGYRRRPTSCAATAAAGC